MSLLIHKKKVRQHLFPTFKSTLKHFLRIMKSLVNILTNSLNAQPTEAIPRGTEILDRVLKAWVPEIYDYPEQLAQIRKYSRQNSTHSFTKNKSGLNSLGNRLIKAPPYLTERKLDELFILLDGLKIALEHFDLKSEKELDILLQARKTAFLSSLFDHSAHLQTNQKTKPDKKPKRP